MEGGEAIQFTTDPANDLHAVWSPDGKWLAFASDRGGSANVWVVSADGSETRQVTTDADSVSQALGCVVSWSPDGSQIFFTRTSGIGDIWIADLSGLGVLR